MITVEELIELLEKVKREELCMEDEEGRWIKDACVEDEEGRSINDVEVRHTMAEDRVIVVLKH